MPRAKICKCGHYKSNHSQIKVGIYAYKTNEGKCKDCHCVKFILDHFIIGAGTLRMKPVLKMSSLNADGRQHGTS